MGSNTYKGHAVFDLDGTLCDIEHRKHFINPPKGKSPNWDKFFKACGDDIPFPHIINTLKSLIDQGWYVEIWSGRSETVFDITQLWLSQQNISVYQLGETGNRSGVCEIVGSNYVLPIQMRPAGNTIADQILKEDWYRGFKLETGHELSLVIDDRQKVVDMWRSHGIPTVQVAEGNF